jgi:hypothetical protein
MEGLQNRQDDNIKMDLKEVGCEDVNCVELAEDPIQQQTLVLPVLSL